MAETHKILTMESIPDYIDLGMYAPKGIEKFIISDSMQGFFPSAELNLLDGLGFMSDTLPVIDNMLFYTILRDFNLKKELVNTYALVTYQLHGETAADYLSGVSLLGFIDSNYLNNTPVSFRMKNQNMKKLIEKLIEKYEITNTFISGNIRGKNDWNVFNYLPSEYIQMLSERAVSRDNENYPYYAFMNAKKEFYFMNIKELFEQPVVHTFDVGVEPADSVGNSTIFNYIFMQDGAAGEFFNYHQKTFYVDEHGSFQERLNKIDNHIPKLGSGGVLNMFQKNLEDVRINNDLGVFSNEACLGVRNSKYRDGALNNRLNISCHYNPDLVAGKIINLRVGSYEENQAYNNYLVSGKYIILESSHIYFNDRDSNVNFPTTQLVIAKPYVVINEKNRLYDELVKI